MHNGNRAWITSAGVSSPYGSSISKLWRGVLHARSVLAKVQVFDVTKYQSWLAGEVPDFDPNDVPGRLRPRTDRSTQLALITAQMALESSDYEHVDPELRSIVTANSAGGYAFGEKELQNMYRRGPAYVSTAQSYAWFYAVNTGQISIRYELKGPSSTVVTDAAGGLDAIWRGTRLVEAGQEIVLAGAVESFLSPLAWVSMESTGRLSTSHDPSSAYLPLTGRAMGQVPAEGGAFLVLRPERPLEEQNAISVVGHGSSMTVDEPASSAIKRAILKALEMADLEAEEIDVVFADGSGVPSDDQEEARALIDIFGENGVPVTAPKAGFGRAGSGMGPLDVVLAALSLRTKSIPGTPGGSDLPIDGLDLVARHRRTAKLKNALVLARGLPVFNSALVLGVR